MSDPVKKSILIRLRNYFITGAIVLIPIGITVYLSLFIVKISSSILPKKINPNSYLPFDIPGIEILITIILITLIGSLSLSFLGKKFLEVFNSILKKIPILRTIYSAVGQLTESFTQSDGIKKSVVILEYPRKGIWVVGFATKENKGEISKKTGIPVKALQEVVKKGKGAYYSSGSRPNQTAESWGKARMYSFIIGGPTRKYDNHIAVKYNLSFAKHK